MHITLYFPDDDYQAYGIQEDRFNSTLRSPLINRYRYAKDFVRALQGRLRAYKQEQITVDIREWREVLDTYGPRKNVAKEITETHPRISV